MSLMTKGSIPPQAYTRETYRQAFLWLKNQPDSTKQLAVTADALVGLYLRSRKSSEPLVSHPAGASAFPQPSPMAGVSAIESVVAPVSAHTFRSHLKDLAGELQQFSEDENEPPVSSPNPGSVHGEPREVSSDEPTMSRTPRPAVPALSLDPISKGLIHDVKSRLNLSHDEDVIRMMLVMGYERLKDVLPK